ncbi:VirE N-terminal domain-containing protein [Chryseobacterium sp. RU37D]|uniref:DUF3987 domain-containing protein n=1 Tax=Chryseobacterium sp. RU37D TaxID=1907397 RepID=UPI000956DBE6|nr:DUF3987 domain-containing protein [Chryseobacterium sp. RU37D]SIQ55600.1 VirE N-terminal domain-containing protein [Chryseobacterium sp. RU37D]
MENIPAFDPVISVCENIRLPKNIKQVSLSSVLERIKNPEQRIIDLQTKFKETKDDKYKRGLPGFTTSGIFSERKASGLTSASGLMMLDFDKLPDPETLQREKEKLIGCPFVVATFISPSGKGLKAIIRIRDWQNQSDYKSIFMEAGAYFNSEYFDSGTSDIARLAFFAHDQDIYINWDAEIFDPEHHLDRDRDTFEKIVVKWMENQNESFIDGNRNKYVFKIAGACCRFGIEKENALILIEEHITITPEFDLSEVVDAINSAYKTNEFGAAHNDFEFWDVENEGKSPENFQTTKENPFPIEVFPEKVRDIITELKNTMTYPVDYTAAGMMYAVSIATGRACRVKFKEEWIDNAVFYLAIVGKAGANKTHPLRFAVKPLRKIDEESYKKYIDEKDKYEFFEKLSKKEKAEKQSELPQKPFRKQFLVSDFTFEALVDVLSKNKNTVGVCVDELASWFLNFNKYNNGSEEQNWLSVWNGESISVNRKGTDDYLIPNPFISVIGTIQNSVLADLAKGSRVGNGFLHRFLFAFPDDQDKKKWSRNKLDKKYREKWENIITEVLELHNNKGFILECSPEAENCLMDWQHRSTDYLNKIDDEILTSIYNKFDTYVVRLSLLMEVFYYACGESELMEISLRSAEAAITLVKYFSQTALKVNSIISKSGNKPVEKLPPIKQHVFNALPEEFTSAEGTVIAAEKGMSSSTFRRFIKEDQGKGKKNIFFETVKHGVYRKKYNSTHA